MKITKFVIAHKLWNDIIGYYIDDLYGNSTSQLADARQFSSIEKAEEYIKKLPKAEYLIVEISIVKEIKK